MAKSNRFSGLEDARFKRPPTLFEVSLKLRGWIFSGEGIPWPHPRPSRVARVQELNGPECLLSCDVFAAVASASRKAATRRAEEPKSLIRENLKTE
jgi:hypothetical protein